MGKIQISLLVAMAFLIGVVVGGRGAVEAAKQDALFEHAERLAHGQD